MTGFMITISPETNQARFEWREEIVIMKLVIICVATDPETNQVRFEWREEIVIMKHFFMSLKPYLVSFRISSYIDYDWFHDYYFFMSLKSYMVSFRISSCSYWSWN
jgi:hypothetical protein